ncbi:oligosaccharide flippase family protein, partial [Candidatus Daviesbacteria bacterium]|nr:oligosaccharide flippase family protein [Candidatus Daviesbacteria bacterium]
GYFLSDSIAKYLFQKPELSPGLKIAFLAVIFTLIYGFVVSYLKALQKFFLWAAVQVGANLVRVIAILALFLFGLITVEVSLWTYVLTLLTGFIIGIIFLVPKDFLFVKKENSVASELFHYNKWIASFTLVAAFSSRLDTFIGARLLTSTDIGLYSAANQLVYIVPQIIGALGTVIAPKMAGMEASQVVAYLKKSQLLVLGLAFLGLLAAPVVAFLVPYIFGSQYVDATPPFFVLLLAMLVFLIAVPVHNVILYYYSYPKLFFYLAIGHLVIISILGWLMISSFGIMGAAVTVLVGTIFNFVVPTLWVLKRIK